MSWFDRSSIDVFADLDKNYELLLRRMQKFDEQAKTGNFPKKTMQLFASELKSYLSIVEAENSKTQDEIAQAKKQLTKEDSNTRNTSIFQNIWQLNLVKKKLDIIHSQLDAVYKKWSHAGNAGDADMEVSINIDIDALRQKKELTSRFFLLFDIFQRHNKKHISVELDNAFEAQLEKQPWFLWVEVQYLTNLTNMLSKIHAQETSKNKICRGILTPLHNTRRLFRTQKQYIITGPIQESLLKKEYDTQMSFGNTRHQSAYTIQQICAVLDQLQQYNESKKEAADIYTQCLWYIATTNDIHILIWKIHNITNLDMLTQQLTHLVKKKELLSPFLYSANFAKTEIIQIVTLYHAKIDQATTITLASLEHERKTIQKQMDLVTLSLQGIKDFQYIPFESLAWAQKRIIKLKTEAGIRWIIRSKLIKKLEERYTLTYQELMQQIASGAESLMTTSWRRNGFSWSWSSGWWFGWFGSWRWSKGGSGWRSTWWGSSFSGGGWRSSGGTSW
jgi:hypothetical protein